MAALVASETWPTIALVVSPWAETPAATSSNNKLAKTDLPKRMLTMIHHSKSF
jgi:hypothetical protein